MSTKSYWMVLMLCIVPNLASGQLLEPLGEEFQVNTYTTDQQLIPVLAIDPQGRFVIVWNSAGSSGSDNSANSIQGQRFNSDGSFAGAEFQVNTYTTDYQVDPDVALGDDGDFVIVWASDGSNGSDPGRSVLGQLFSSDGSTAGAEFQVNAYTTGDQAAVGTGGPAVAKLTDGSFIVAFDSAGSSGIDDDGLSLQARLFGSDGSPQGNEFEVNNHTVGDQTYPAVAAADNSFVVVWHSTTSSANDNSGYSIQARRFASDGTALGDQFQVNTYTTGAQQRPDVASRPNGEFAVVWESEGSSGSDDSDFSVQVQRFASDGTPIGQEIQVNTFSTSTQFVPSVALHTDGSFAVVWDSNGSVGDDSSSRSIQGQSFAANNTALGQQFQANTFTTSAQGVPAIAAGAGGFVVSWFSFGSTGTDDQGGSIQARRYQAALFADGFESGDTTAWSSSVP